MVRAQVGVSLFERPKNKTKKRSAKGSSTCHVQLSRGGAALLVSCGGSCDPRPETRDPRPSRPNHPDKQKPTSHRGRRAHGRPRAAASSSRGSWGQALGSSRPGGLGAWGTCEGFTPCGMGGLRHPLKGILKNRGWNHCLLISTKKNQIDGWSCFGYRGHPVDVREIRFTPKNMQGLLLHGSLHYTPEHCLANGGFPLFSWKKPCFKWLQNVSFNGPIYRPQLEALEAAKRPAPLLR